MKRVASGTSLSSMKRSTSMGGTKRSGSIGGLQKSKSEISLTNIVASDVPAAVLATPSSSMGASNSSESHEDHHLRSRTASVSAANEDETPIVDDNTFRARLLRGVNTILRSKLLLTIFTFNALYASTSALLSFQRADLISKRSSSSSSNNSAESDTAFLAKINMASSVAVFVLQISGLGAWIAHACGPRGTLSLMPIVRLCGVILLLWWHMNGDGRPPNLIVFLMLDELTRIINFAVAKPVRESLWSGLSHEARYEAKPIVDTIANRWGSGSAAFSIECIDWCLDSLSLGVGARGNRTVFGFPPDLLLLFAIASWWTGVSLHLGYVREKIDIELKKRR